ncbi:MAG: tyrosine-type recombinase/integrase [Cyclobacteriaceae bacterium]|nr:tyrosine-type recombinase/integrase [Cyclobacteriaceae bacterium]
MTESFLKYLRYEKRVSPHTLAAYQNDLRQFEKFISNTFPQESLERAEHNVIRSWIIELVDQGLDATSINRKIACLRTFYKFLRIHGALNADPMSRIRVLKTRKRLPDFVREENMKSALDASASADDAKTEKREGKKSESIFSIKRKQLIIELLYGTGMRLSELIGLKETDIDLKNCVIKVLGKRNKERIIPFPQSLVSLISEYRKLKQEATPGAADRLIVTDSGLPSYPMMIYRIVRQCLQESGSKRKSPHILRHTYATHLLDRGAEINAVKDLLGHSSLAATQVYTHNSMEKLRKIYEQAHPKA